MQALGKQALRHLGDWIRAHWGDAVQIVSSHEEVAGDHDRASSVPPDPVGAHPHPSPPILESAEGTGPRRRRRGQR